MQQDSRAFKRQDIVPGYWYPMDRAPDDTVIDLWCVPNIPNTSIGIGLRFCDCFWDKSINDWVANGLLAERKERVSVKRKDGSQWKPTHWMLKPGPPGFR